jgi:hypothetical protein
MPPRGRPIEFPIKKLIAIDENLLDGVERFQKDNPTLNQSEAFRHLLRIGLVEAGYLRRAAPNEGIPVKDLNASNDE